MTIIVNCRFLTQNLTGVQRFAEEITKRLPQSVQDIELVAPCEPLRHEALGGVPVHKIGRLHGHPWEQIELADYVKRRRATLLSLANTGPIAIRNQILVIHDLTWHHFPDSYSWRFRTFYRLLTGLLVRRIRQLVTVSDFSRQDIARHFRLKPDEIAVVPNAVDDRFHTQSGVRPERAPAGDYFLVVSSLNKHKNVGPFVEAFRKYKSSSKTTTKLVLVGGSSKAFAVATRSERGPRAKDIVDGVVALGRVSDDELIWLYRHAKAFFFPSLYEGFGIPPLEALACGCPVFSSNAASLPDVLGERALYFSPTDMEGILDALGSADRLRHPNIRRNVQTRFETWQQSVDTLVPYFTF